MNISASLEDYLYAIYKLQDKEFGTRVTDISNLLNVKKSSTNSALNILKNEKLINYEKYKNVTLTAQGLARAKHIRKKKETFRKFLLEVIKTDKLLADIEADKLAHCISCHTTAKLEKFIESILENKA